MNIAGMPAPTGSGAMPPDLLVEILIYAEKLDAIIVGGQALNIWGEHYFDVAKAELSACAPFQSKDIDFYGDRQAAKDLAVKLNGKMYVPDPADTTTASSAAVTIEIDGVTYQVDFLRAVAGLSLEVMKKRAQKLVVPLPTSDGSTRDVSLRVLHPVDTLLSRIASITVLRREDPGAVRQLAAAPIILREFISELLAADQLVEAQNAVRALVAIGGKAQNDQVYTAHGIDILSHAERLAADPKWDPRFAYHQISKAAHRRSEQRNRRIVEALRRQNYME
jgi:hypothetical protein